MNRLQALLKSCLPLSAALALSSVLIGSCATSAPDLVPEVQPAAAEPVPVALATDCADGVVKDDGTVETGYGFVPQATDGVYVQKFEADDFPSRTIDRVCVCWLKTRHERDVEFEVVFYEDAGGVPAAEPYASIPGTATGLPDSVEAAGAFFPVDVSGVTLPAGPSYVGARWNPSEAKFLFVCTDTGEGTSPTDVFFKEDRAKGWTSVYASRDPIFRNHRSILVRAHAASSPPPTP